MSSRLSKIRSVHTYVMIWTVYFGWICRSQCWSIRVCKKATATNFMLTKFSTPFLKDSGFPVWFVWISAYFPEKSPCQKGLVIIFLSFVTVTSEQEYILEWGKMLKAGILESVYEFWGNLFFKCLRARVTCIKEENTMPSKKMNPIY